VTNTMTSITHAFIFHAAHQLHWHPGKCARLHGHTYRCEIEITGTLDSNGIVVDFDIVDALVTTTVLTQLDHVLLNEVIPNPTAELVAAFILDELTTAGLEISQVRLWETPDSSAIVRKIG
jgi:6-pyruvoyltetrahydropterin/6-carboxytetrahydropterin synthase